MGLLIRTEPFSTCHIGLQHGYDCAGRLFSSIPKLWSQVSEVEPDYRELPPEFFCSPRFLVNENEFELGLPEGDVILPPWAKSHYEFVYLNRRALESEFVSVHLNEWIDLIFGVTQRSLEHNNLFHPWCYADALDGVNNEDQMMIIKHYALNFGVCPLKLFETRHAKRDHPRKVAGDGSPKEIEAKVVAVGRGCVLTASGSMIDFVSKTPPVVELKWRPDFAFWEISTNYVVAVSGDRTSVHVCPVSKAEISLIPHKLAIINACVILGDVLLTAGSDCMVYMWNLKNIKLITKIPVHASSIVKLAATLPLDLIVSLDEEGYVFFTSLSLRRVMHMFSIGKEGRSSNLIAIAENGIVGITSEAENERSAVASYDLCGTRLARREIPGVIGGLIAIHTEDGYDFFAVTTSKRTVWLLDVVTLEEYKRFADPVIPRFLGSIGERNLILAYERHQVEYVIQRPF
jgi:hypothetical protein